MITTMTMLFIIGILSAAAIAAANGDIRFSRYDQDDKEAYAAAEAGINDYFAHLQLDPNYWTRCAGEDSSKPLGTGNAVNEQFTGTPPAGRKWRDVSGSNGQYSIELIPAPGKSSCSTTDPPGSMIDGDGNFRIRATGHVKGTKNYKAVVATFRRTGFLDYLYFTDFENQDPTYLTLNSSGVTTRATSGNGTATGGPDLATWAGTNCDRHWWGSLSKTGQGRAQSPTWHGQYNYGSGWTPSSGIDVDTSSVCGEITFASDDQVNGPFHSNDDILTSGSPDFGRTGNKDRVEVANLGGSDQGWRGSGANPNFRTPNGKLAIGARTLSLPPGNNAIKAQAQAGYLYTGPTKIVINSNNTMNVTTNGSTNNSVPLPSNGVIYVQNSSCTYGYKPNDSQNIDDGCGVAQVSGTYNQDLTIAAEDDVIVMDDLQRLSGSNAVLGLVANSFVRVWHPVSPSPRSGGSCTNSGSPTNIKIDAAILSLKHSFTVDNYDCGASLGTLAVNGAIAQKHRGIVGTSGGTGYIKNYTYDDRLKYRSPPYFLDPVQAAWRVLRENDQSGAR